MLGLAQLHKYQSRAVAHVVRHKASMLWLDMGLGKTIIVLTAIMFLRAIGQLDKVLVVAPLRVCQTVWAQEAKGWSHTQSLKFSRLTGSTKDRLQALFTPADVYLINYENIPWLVGIMEHYWTKETCPFQLLVWDEISKMKHSTSGRGKAARKILPWFHRKVGLTGTPSSNGIIDLHGQFLVLDEGERLTPRIAHFREKWFYLDAYVRKYMPFPDSKKQIESRIKDITLQMDSKDYIEMPELSVLDLKIELPPKVRDEYDRLVRDLYVVLATRTIEVDNASALSMKCRQFANGHLYHTVGNKDYAKAHMSKLDVLDEILAQTGDQPILLAYAFQSDVAEIQKKYPYAVNLSGMQGKELVQTMYSWNAGLIKLLIGHPASMGHGLNIQHGGHYLVWFSPPWELDLYAQMIARLHRQGQRNTVICYRLIVTGTVEEVMYRTLADKASTEDSLRRAIGLSSNHGEKI